MLRTKSALKKQRQNIKRRAKNNLVKSTLRTKIKRFQSAVKNNDIPDAEQKLREVISDLDRAASKGVIHSNTSSRHAGRLSRQLHKAKSGSESQAS